MTDLGDRLRQLRRPPLPPALPEARPEEVPLKVRLERLVAVAARGRGPRRAAAGLEELVQGQRLTSARGECFLVETDVHLDTFHGDVSLSRFRSLVPGSVGVLTGEPSFDAFDLSQAAFLDTETTGLAGGTGTAAFLVGLGFVAGDRFVVRQYFMRDYHEEPALLLSLAEDLRRFEALVTFNGRMFDVPLLETRYRLDRARFPLEDAPHLDLLLPARRLWKARLDSCALQSLEVALLGLRRRDDIPGDAIPGIYFDWVRRRDGRALARVFNHNRTDIVSLAALALRACRWVEGGEAEDPRDVFSLARVLERARLYERSEAAYLRAVANDRGAVRVAALVRLASRAKRAGEHGRALALWRQAAGHGDLLAHRELAVHHEHRSGDLDAALESAEAALRLVESRGAPGGVARAFEHRRRRLLRKLRRGGARSLSE
ncbi:MAG TPA: ribonuclease H-like domain-containing protein [Vicinamibacteria bacterium]|nr:ribonuclease H-like domain-containing protein [Vicinamibacteria bacterium]